MLLAGHDPLPTAATAAARATAGMAAARVGIARLAAGGRR